MTTKLDKDRLSAELASLDALLRSLPANDYLGRMGLEARREAVQQQFEALGEQEDHRAKVALYFGGDPVIGSAGVEAEFGSKVIGSFQDLLSKVWGEEESGELLATGPVRKKGASQLHITQLVQGSFGFLLEELDQEPMFETPLSRAADQVATYMASFASENEASFSEVMDDLNPRVFQSLKDFFGFVHKAKATFRVVEGQRDDRFDRIAVERAWFRAEEFSIDDDRVRLEGRLLGVIPIRRRFEFEPDGGVEIIEGRVGDLFSQSYLERIRTEQLIGRRWKALLNRRIVTKVGRRPRETYTLMELHQAE